MRHDDWTHLNDVVITSTMALLADHGIGAEYDANAHGGQTQWAETLAVIGLGGQKLRGSVVLSIPNNLLAGTHPTQSNEAEDWADWLAELANLLLGRLKVKLLERGLAIELGTPVTITGTALRLHRFKGLPMVHGFKASAVTGDKSVAGDVHVVFEAIGEDGAQLASIPNTEVALDAGEVVLF